jgi:flagellar hook-associated protein 1
MYSSFHGLEVGRRAILAQQAALSTTGHNIANANTKGYTRQEAMLAATRGLAIPGMNTGTQPMQLGTGVEVAQLKRIRNQFLDLQYRNEQQKLGYYETKAEALSNVEGVFNEPSEHGLDMALNRFWQSMQELAKQPDNLSARTVAISNGQALAMSFNEISAGLTQNQQILSKQLDDQMKGVNTSLSEVAALNNQIALAVASGNQPNDLLDKRDLLLDSISKQIGAQLTPGDNGMVNVSVGGITLVSGNQANTLTLENGQVKVGADVAPIEGGEVKGLLDSQVEIANIQLKMDKLAQTMADHLNGIQTSSAAKSLEDIDNPNGTAEKIPFFVSKDPTKPLDASNMIVNPQLINAPEKLAAAQSNSRGDGSNAALMANLQTQKITIDGKETTIGDYYHMILGEVGTGVQNAERYRDNADARVQQIDMQKQSVSGVSIDEEMTNMVRYQQAYNAAAKYVSAVNEMLDKLINGMV